VPDHLGEVLERGPTLGDRRGVKQRLNLPRGSGEFPWYGKANAMTQQERFTRKFEDEAVWLVGPAGGPSGRSPVTWGSGCRR